MREHRKDGEKVSPGDVSTDVAGALAPSLLLHKMHFQDDEAAERIKKKKDPKPKEKKKD